MTKLTPGSDAAGRFRIYDCPVTDEPDDKGSGGETGLPPSLAKTDGSADMADAEKAAAGNVDDDVQTTKAKARAKVDDQVDDEAETKKAKAKVVPATPKQDALTKDDAAAEPPARASALDLHAPMTYPDDGPFSARVRKIDDYLGKTEQIVLVAILAAIVLTGAGHALLEKFAHIRIPFKDDVIRAGTFAIAMIGGAFATHQSKHLSMDLLSRRFSPRNRLFLKITLSLFAIFVLILLVRSGMHNIDNEKQFRAEDKLVSRVRIAYLIPIGGVLMLLHTFLHTLIDIDYIKRRKTPPERMRSGH